MNSLRTHLIFYFLALIILPLSLAVWSFSQAFERSTRNFVEQVTSNALVHTQAEISANLESAIGAVEYTNDIFKTGTIKFPSTNNQNSERTIREFLKSNVIDRRGLKNVGIVNLEDRHFFMSFVDRDQHLVVKETIDQAGNSLSRFWGRPDYRDTVGIENDLWRPDNFRVDQRPWYQAALNQSGEPDFELAWTNPYPFKESGEIGLTASKAINVPGQGFRAPFAIAFADVSLESVASLLRSLELGHRGEIFLVDADQTVLASSLDTQPIWVKEHGQLPSMSDIAAEFGEKETWSRLDVADHERSPLLLIKHDKGDYFAHSMALTADGVDALNLSLWVFMPREALLEDFFQSAKEVYLYAGVALFAALVVCFGVWSKISRELGGVISAFDRVADGDLQTEVTMRRPYLETQRLITNFNRMLHTLWENFYMQRLISKSAKDDVAAKSAQREEERLIGSSARKYCTCLFSDIRGFTAYSESRDPQKVINVLNHYLSLQVQIIKGYGGDIDKFVGDQVVAIFQGDNAEEAALEAANDICMAINRSNCENLIDELEVGIGVHAGHVVFGYVGDDDRAEFTAIGSTVNFAARLCSKAGSSEVWFSEAVAKAIDTNIRRDVVDAVEFKGIDGHPRVFRLLMMAKDGASEASKNA